MLSKFLSEEHYNPVCIRKVVKGCTTTLDMPWKVHFLGDKLSAGLDEIILIILKKLIELRITLTFIMVNML